MARLILLSGLILMATSGSAFQVQLTVVNSTCGNNNGSISASVVGGSGPLNYNWTPAPPIGNGTPHISGLAPGIYSVDVTDGGGTTVTTSATVLDMPTLDVPTAILNSSFMRACAGQCTGQLYLNETLLGGEGPYTISTVPSMSLNGICGNTPFTLNVTDALGCSGTGNTVIPETELVSVIGYLVQGPCGGAPTNTTFYFDGHFPDLGGTWSGPGGTVSPPIGSYLGNTLVVPGTTMPGVYVYVAPGIAPCPNQSYQFIIPATVVDCSTVDGDLFVDVNGNCIMDGTDFPLPNKIITLEPGGLVALTDAFGHYRFQVPYGTYDLAYTDPIYTQNCPVASPVNFTLDAGTPSTTIDLALTSGDPDVSIACAIGQAVPGFKQTHSLTVTNNSAISSGPLTVTLDHDPVLTYTPVWYCAGGGPFGGTIGYWNYPDTYSPGQVQWELMDGLEPGAQAFLSVQLLVPPDVTLLGTALNSTATVSTPLNETDLSNNVCSHSEIVVGSFDPNDMQARTTGGSGDTWVLEEDSSITYTLRFQNTGTARATNVVLRDTLSELLDLSTLRILGASHAYAVGLDSARELRFTFDRIMLPDSGTNDLASHGFAQFSIRPVAGLVPGNSIDNSAGIYFDYNSPVLTNTSQLLVTSTTGIKGASRSSLSVYPVPAGDLLMFRTGSSGRTAYVIAMDGRIVRIIADVDGRLSVAGLSPGAYVLRLVDAYGNEERAPFVKE